MNKFKKIIVTGASGFVSRNLRKYLSKQNIELISISRNNFKQFKYESKIISKNYNEKNLLKKIKNSETLIHLVGIGKQSVDIDYNLVNKSKNKKNYLSKRFGSFGNNFFRIFYF